MTKSGKEAIQKIAKACPKRASFLSSRPTKTKEEEEEEIFEECRKIRKENYILDKYQNGTLWIPDIM